MRINWCLHSGAHSFLPPAPIPPELELQSLTFRSDGSHQGRVPTLIMRPPPSTPVPRMRRRRRATQQQQAPMQQQQAPMQQQQQVPMQQQCAAMQPAPRRPAVVLIHASYACKETMLPEMAAYARAGFVAATIDNRYHGERAVEPPAEASAASGSAPNGGSGSGGGSGPERDSGSRAEGANTAAAAEAAAGAVPAPPVGQEDRGRVYQEAIIRAWRGRSEERPFLLDTVW
jgi:hypothetical protein